MKYNVSIYRELRVRVCDKLEVEAENPDEAEDVAWESIKSSLTLDDIDIRDCIYSDDVVTEINEV